MLNTLFKNKNVEIIEDKAEIITDDINTQETSESATETIAQNEVSDNVVVEQVSEDIKNVESQIDDVPELGILEEVVEAKSEQNNPSWTWESIVKEIENVLDTYATTEFDTLNLKNVIYGIIRKTL